MMTFVNNIDNAIEAVKLEGENLKKRADSN